MVIETLIDILGHLERVGILDTEKPHEGGHQDLGATVSSSAVQASGSAPSPYRSRRPSGGFLARAVCRHCP